MRKAFAGLLVIGLALTGCGGEKKGGAATSPSAATTTPAETNAVAVEAIDFGYTVSGTAKSGLTRITFKNTGTELHMLDVSKLKEGKTAADALAALKTDDDKDDAATFVDPDDSLDAQPNILSPSATTTVWTKLESGTYALVCYVPGEKDGQPHFLKGMVNALTVTADATTAPEPQTQGEITTDDKKLTLPDLSSGKGTFKYTNSGDTTHSLLLVKLNDGKTFADFVTWVDKYFEGKAKFADRPGDLWGGVESTEETAFLELDLPPGKYLALDTDSPEDEDEEYFRDSQGGLRAEFTVT